jgi:hypothetical protein
MSVDLKELARRESEQVIGRESREARNRVLLELLTRKGEIWGSRRGRDRGSRPRDA